MATVAVAFFKVFKEFGFGAAIVQREKLESGHLDTAFWTDIFVNLLMMVITLLSAKWVSTLYGDPRLEIIIQALSLTFLPAALSQVHTFILRRNLEFKALAIRTLNSGSSWGGGRYCMCSIWVRSVEPYSKTVNSYNSRNINSLGFIANGDRGLEVSRVYFNDLFSFSVNMFVANIVNFFGSRSDSFLIGYFLGPVSLGYYTIAQRPYIAID